MFNGKNKAVTFSYDDGVVQDKRLTELFDKYSLKATFNINSGLLGTVHGFDYNGKRIDHSENKAEEINKIYKNHEIAAHTLTHPNLTEADDSEIINQVENDRIRLSELAGYDVEGMAYPCGGVNNNEHVAGVIKKNTKVKYARTITSTYNFDIQQNLYRFNPTVYHLEIEKMFELAKEFIDLKTDEPKLYYIWGHSYEFDYDDTWDTFEELLKIISNRDDIFYGTNSQVLLNK